MLPFAIQENEELQENLIDDVQVYSLDEWNEQFKKFPAKRLKEILRS